MTLSLRRSSNSSQLGELAGLAWRGSWKQKSPLTTCDWVFPWCFLAKLSASLLPAAAEGFKCEGIAREAIVSESVEPGKIGFKLGSDKRNDEGQQSSPGSLLG